MNFDFEHVKHLMGVDIMSIEHDLNKHINRQDTIDRRDARLRKLYPLDDILKEHLLTYLDNIGNHDMDYIIHRVLTGFDKQNFGDWLVDEIKIMAILEQDRLVEGHGDE